MAAPVNTLARLLLLAAAVGCYQLPVIKDRASSLHLHGLELLLQPPVEALNETFGAGPRALHQQGEQRKIALQATLLEQFEPSVELPLNNRQQPLPYESHSAASESPAVTAVQPILTPVTTTASTKPQTAPSDSSAPGRGVLSPPILANASTPALKTPASSQGPSPLASREPGTVLLVGDSVMGEIAYGMKRWSAKNKPWQVVDAHKVSSGLCNTGYYDWPTVFAALVEEHKPRLVAMMIGANDEQDIFVGRKRYSFGSADWAQTYAERINAILEAAHKANAVVYWVLPPVMRDSGVEKRMVIIRKVLRETLEQNPEKAVLVDEGFHFEDKDGHYAETALVNGKTRSLRAEDGIHLSTAGAQILVDALLRTAIAPATGTVAPAGAASAPIPTPEAALKDVSAEGKSAEAERP
jgi:hypothetical protein